MPPLTRILRQRCEKATREEAVCHNTHVESLVPG